MAITHAHISLAIRAIRERRGLRQSDCAERAGYATHVGWLHLESGRRTLNDLGILVTVARALGIKLSELIAEAEMVDGGESEH